MNENEFSYGGKTYVAVERDTPCHGCVFWGEDCGGLKKHGKIPYCSKGAREDGIDVRFVMKDTEEASDRTREERDKLREEVAELSRANAELAARNVELRTKIEHLRYDVACWRGEAEAEDRLADALAKDNELLAAKGKAKR